jgi:hypothetical protein
MPFKEEADLCWGYGNRTTLRTVPCRQAPKAPRAVGALGPWRQVLMHPNRLRSGMLDPGDRATVSVKGFLPLT